jgi:hypothetical protein
MDAQEGCGTEHEGGGFIDDGEEGEAGTGCESDGGDGGDSGDDTEPESPPSPISRRLRSRTAPAPSITNTTSIKTTRSYRVTKKAKSGKRNHNYKVSWDGTRTSDYIPAASRRLWIGTWVSRVHPDVLQGFMRDPATMTTSICISSRPASMNTSSSNAARETMSQTTYFHGMPNRRCPDFASTP